jgi:hypothetical protein
VVAAVAGIRLRAFAVAVLSSGSPPPFPFPSLTSSRVSAAGCWVLLFLFFGAGQMRGWCTGGASVSTNAENVLLHSLRVLPLLMLLRVQLVLLLQLLLVLVERRRAMMVCVVLLRRTSAPSRRCRRGGTGKLHLRRVETRVEEEGASRFGRKAR